MIVKGEAELGRSPADPQVGTAAVVVAEENVEGVGTIS
jgi:hypothetical protein